MATFDLYEKKKYWWWYCYLAMASVKDNKKEYDALVEMVFDAISYYDNYEDIIERTRVKTKYGTNDTK